MSVKITIDLRGDEELLRKLRGLTPAAGARVVKTATSRALTPISNEIRANIRRQGIRDTGALQKSIGKKTKAYRGRGVVVAIAGPRYEYTQTGEDGRMRRPANYAHLVEQGHYANNTWVEPRPFMRPAYDSKRHEAEKVWRSTAAAAITKELAKKR